MWFTEYIRAVPCKNSKYTAFGEPSAQIFRAAVSAFDASVSLGNWLAVKVPAGHGESAAGFIQAFLFFVFFSGVFFGVRLRLFHQVCGGGVAVLFRLLDS